MKNPAFLLILGSAMIRLEGSFDFRDKASSIKY